MTLLSQDVAPALADDFATLAVLHDRELTTAVAEELRAIAFPDNLALLPAGQMARDAAGLMRQAVADLPALLDAGLMDELAADYAAIYLTGGYGVSPCESYWLDEDHLVCQQPMFALRELYQRAGLAVPDWRRRADDHLVCQLEFLSRMLARVKGDEDWKFLGAYLDDHLLRWLPEFSARVVARCTQPFHAALCLLTEAWCRELRERITEELG